jgi:hypothetical protein
MAILHTEDTSQASEPCLFPASIMEAWRVGAEYTVNQHHPICASDKIVYPGSVCVTLLTSICLPFRVG